MWEKTMIYYTSDLHLGHDNIIRLCNRPYKDARTMGVDIIQRWNKKVHVEDTVYILGDMFFKYQDIDVVKTILKQLNGKKILIRGNHDNFLNQIVWKDYFASVKDYMRINDNGRDVILFHYPIEEWDGYFRGSYHLYGHVHNSDNGTVGVKKNRFNVGVDVNDFEPKTLDELINKNKKLCHCYHPDGYYGPECWGTRERDNCKCNGDKNNCDFYNKDGSSKLL